MLYRRVLPALVVMAVVGVVLAAVLVGFLFAGVSFVPFGVAAGIEAVLVVPAFVAGVLTNASSRRSRTRQRLDLRRLFRGVPSRLLVAAAVLFFAFWLIGATGFIGVGGNVEIQNGQYVLDEHGSITVVDKATYDRQLAQQSRIQISVLGAFGVGGAVLCLATVVRGGRLNSAPKDLRL